MAEKAKTGRLGYFMNIRAIDLALYVLERPSSGTCGISNIEGSHVYTVAHLAVNVVVSHDSLAMRLAYRRVVLFGLADASHSTSSTNHRQLA